MSRRQQFILIPRWDGWFGGGEAPKFIGPFLSEKDADQFARMNIPRNGTWEIEPLDRPYADASDR